MSSAVCDALAAAAKELGAGTARLKFGPPITHVYNPLVYAWAAHEIYLRRYCARRKRVVFLGMNPGPFGMVQTGIPFGEIRAVLDWLEIATDVGRPEREHPRRPVNGLGTVRSEVSGRRLWGLFAERFGSPKEFFREHAVVNYCPLAFVEASGRNRTPDKLPGAERGPLFALCDRHLRAVAAALQPDWLIGVGDFAAKRAEEIFPSGAPKVGRILHPSPANPAANRDWPGVATRQLEALGVW